MASQSIKLDDENPWFNATQRGDNIFKSKLHVTYTLALNSQSLPLVAETQRLVILSELSSVKSRGVGVYTVAL